MVAGNWVVVEEVWCYRPFEHVIETSGTRNQVLQKAFHFPFVGFISHFWAWAVPESPILAQIFNKVFVKYLVQYITQRIMQL